MFTESVFGSIIVSSTGLFIPVYIGKGRRREGLGLAVERQIVSQKLRTNHEKHALSPQLY